MVTVRRSFCNAFTGNPYCHRNVGAIRNDLGPGGCRLELLASEPGANHVLFHGVSPNGRLLAVGWDSKKGGRTERGSYLLELATGNRTPLTHLNNAPSFSPDGRYLVSANYVGRELKTELVELDRRTGKTRTVASSPAFEWLATYSRNGRSILFNSTRTGASDLYRVDRNSGAIERLTSDPRYEAHGQMFGRQQQLIYHLQTADHDYDIIIADLRSRKSRKLAATPLEEAYPAASPNGKWIVFSGVATPGHNPNLYIMSADGRGNRRRLTHSEPKDAYATWSPDGRWLYFVRFLGEGAQIYRTPMRSGDCERRGAAPSAATR